MKKKFQLPHIFVILFAIIVLAALLTWIIPAGEFERMENEAGRMVVVPGTWHKTEQTPVGFFDVFGALYRGMLDASDIVFFVFISFASVQFIIKSGAFDGLVVELMKILKGNSAVYTIPVFLALFGLGSSTVGMFEEWLPFVPVFVAVFIAMGFDAIVGLAVVMVGAGLGYSGAFMNPFTVGVAQGIAEVEYMSGAGFRIIIHIVTIIVCSIFICRYALKVKNDPTKSLVYGDDFSSFVNENAKETPFGLQQKLVLLTLLATIVVVIWGVKVKGWYFQEIAIGFILMGIVSAIIMRMSLNEIGDTFGKGFTEACTSALMIGIARAIKLVLVDGCIIDTVVYGLSLPLQNLPKAVSAVAMIIMQTLLNFFIPSGSGQAATSMPIMAPMADILGLGRDVAVLAFQFGDGFSNIVWPTAFAAVVSGLAGVKLDKWWKFIFPIFGAVLVCQAVMMVIAVSIGWGV